MPHKYTLLLIIVGVIVLCDQVTKLYIDAVMWPHQSITVIENYFDITYVRNPGGAARWVRSSGGQPKRRGRSPVRTG